MHSVFLDQCNIQDTHWKLNEAMITLIYKHFLTKYLQVNVKNVFNSFKKKETQALHFLHE